MITIKKDKQIIKYYTNMINISNVHKLNKYLTSSWLGNQSSLIKNTKINNNMYSINKKILKMGSDE